MMRKIVERLIEWLKRRTVAQLLLPPLSVAIVVMSSMFIVTPVTFLTGIASGALLGLLLWMNYDVWRRDIE